MRTVFIFIILSSILTSIWFKDGKLLATGEEGLSLYRPLKTFQIYSYPWQEVGTGYPLPVTLPRITLFAFAALLNNFLLSWQTQAVIFFCFLAIGLIGFYYLTSYLLGKGAWIGSIFYLFNLYSLVQIWQRFLLTGIAAWALAPLFLYFLIKYLSTGKFKYLCIFLVSTLALSVCFGAPSWIVTLWTLPGVYLLFYLKALPKFILALSAWILVHIWWIKPYIDLSASAFSQVNNWQSSVGNVRSLSKYFQPLEIIQLREVGTITNPLLNLLSLIVLIITLIGILTPHRFRKFLFSLLLIGIFVSKGTNSLFGEQFYSFMFSNFNFLTVFRNPFEKFGLVILIPITLFFTVGLTRIKPRIIRYLFLVSCTICLASPLLSGGVFANNLKIQVPIEYRQIDQEISSTPGRILQLPYSTGEGIRYTWGYRGEESSEFLFTPPSISREVRTPYYDEFIRTANRHLVSPGFINILSVLNVHYLVLHHDVKADFIEENLLQTNINPSTSWPGVKYITSFGQLDLFALDATIQPKLIYPATRLIYAPNVATSLDLITSSNFKPLSDVVIQDQQITLSQAHLPQLTYSKINPQHYQVDIISSSSPYILVFSSTFHPRWKLKSPSGHIYPHFIANGYANGWLVNFSNDSILDIIFE